MSNEYKFIPYSESFIVSFDFPNNGDTNLMIVGKQKANGGLEIVNAVQGEEAAEIYEKITKVSDDK